MTRRWSLLLAALSLAAAFPAAAAPPAEPAVGYQVKAGDTLYDLAARYLLRRSDLGTVQRLNRVRDPRRLPIGRTLLIPAELLRSDPIVGRLIAFSGLVTVQGPDAGPLRLEMPVREGYRLTTGTNAFLTFELPDGSRVTLPSQSQVRLSRLRRIRLTGAVQRDIELDEGRANSTVAPMPNPASRFQVRTPVAVSAVRGTRFRVRHDIAAGRSLVEVIEGRVGESLADGAQTAEVPTGYGAAVTTDAVGQPSELLPPPALEDPARLQDEPQVTFAVRPLAAASAYRAEIARDAGFVDLIAETSGPAPRLTFDATPNGTYFVRLTALDTAGLEGMPATYAFERRLNTLGLDPPTLVPGARRQYLFKWRSTGGAAETFRFVLGRRPDGSQAVIDAPGLSGREIVVTDLPPGTYYWRVLIARREDDRLFEKWSPPERFEIGR